MASSNDSSRPGALQPVRRYSFSEVIAGSLPNTPRASSNFQRPSILTSRSTKGSPQSSPLLAPLIPPPMGLTAGSSYGGSCAFSLISAPDSDDSQRPYSCSDIERDKLKSDLMKASMDCMGFMCTEISLKHKAAKFREMLSAADSILGVEETTSSSSATGDASDEGNNPSCPNSPPATTRQRIQSNSTTMRTRARTASLLENEIPAVLETMRSNIEECEMLIQSLRYKLDLKEDEGAWGRQTSTSFSLIYGSTRGRLDSDGDGSSGHGSMGRRSSAPPEMRGRRTESYGVWSESESRGPVGESMLEVETSMINYSDEGGDEGGDKILRDVREESNENDISNYHDTDDGDRADNEGNEKYNNDYTGHANSSTSDGQAADTSAEGLRMKMDVLGNNMVDLEARIRAASNPTVLTR